MEFTIHFDAYFLQLYFSPIGNGLQAGKIRRGEVTIFFHGSRSFSPAAVILLRVFYCFAVMY